MKHSILLTLCTLACSAALAQAPAGVVKKPSAESDPIAATGKAGEQAQMNVQDRKADSGSMPMAAGIGGMGGMGGMGPSSRGMNAGNDMRSMDSNRDSMVSKREWQNHYNTMWTRMKPRNGSLSISEMEGKAHGGPN